MENLSFILEPLFSSKLLIVLFLGTLFGLVLGVLPGLGPTTGGALILPFTMTLDPLSAIVLLTSIYCAGTYGGAITAVLINTPGTPAAAATCLDGYPLAQKGEAGRALGMATVSSTVGGIFSVIILVFFAPILAQLAYEFGQPEYFALAIFGLTMLASIGEGSPIKNLIAGAFGILISTVGKDFIKSLPTVEIKIPNAPAIKFLIGLPSPIDASIVKPKIANAKYSGWPNSYASWARIGAKKTRIITLKIPPTVLETVAIPKALPASPFWAKGYPSKQVAAAAGVPGVLIRTAVIAPP